MRKGKRRDFPLVLYMKGLDLGLVDRAHKRIANIVASQYKYTDSRDKDYFFKALHCTAYYRFATKVSPPSTSPNGCRLN